MKNLTAFLLVISIGNINVSAQSKGKSKKLVLTNVNNGVVYYDEQPEYKKDAQYTLMLHFSNPINKTDDKAKVELKTDGKVNTHYPILFYSGPYLGNHDVKSDTLKAVYCWDSTHVIEDKNHPGTMIQAPILAPFTINKYMSYSTYQLHIPAGTFTDIYGNKSDEINITYEKRKK